MRSGGSSFSRLLLSLNTLQQTTFFLAECLENARSTVARGPSREEAAPIYRGTQRQSRPAGN